MNKDNQAPFTEEERATLMMVAKTGDGVTYASLWEGDSLPAEMKIGEWRAKIRREFLAPPTAAAALENILGDCAMQFSGKHARIVTEAADELNRMAKMFDLRPLSELRQEAFGGNRRGASSPCRWVVLWGPSGYDGTPMRCAVGRVAPHDHKFAGRYVRHDGECFTDDGPEATHFSELPDALFGID